MDRVLAMGDGTELDKDILGKTNLEIQELTKLAITNTELIEQLTIAVKNNTKAISVLLTYHYCLECKRFLPSDVYVQSGKPCVACTQKRIEAASISKQI